MNNNNINNDVQQTGKPFIQTGSDFDTATDFPNLHEGHLAPERDRDPAMKLITAPKCNSPRLDGPCHPYTWCQDGKPIDGALQPGAWKLVNHLWQQWNHAASFGELKWPVYGDQEHTAGEDAFGSLRRAANAFFRTHDLPWQVCIKKKVVSLNRLKKISKLVGKCPPSARVLPAPRITTPGNVAKTAVGSRRRRAKSKADLFDHRPKGKRT